MTESEMLEEIERLKGLADDNECDAAFWKERAEAAEARISRHKRIAEFRGDVVIDG